MRYCRSACSSLPQIPRSLELSRFGRRPPTANALMAEHLGRIDRSITQAPRRGRKIVPAILEELRDMEAGDKVISRDKTEVGITTGGTRTCGLEGCLGRHLAVRWPDGKLTYPCTKGMEWYEDAWYIL